MGDKMYEIGRKVVLIGYNRDINIIRQKENDAQTKP